MADRPPNPQAPAPSSGELAALQVAMQALPVGIVVAEARPGGAPVLVAHNSALERIVGESIADGGTLDALPVGLFRADRAVPIASADWPGARAARTGQPVREQELHLRRPDGQWRVVEVSAVPMGSGAEGTTGRAVSVLLDVTEHYLAQEELRRSEAQLRTIVENLGEGIILVDLSGEFLHWNRASLEMHGFAGPEDVPRSYTELRATIELASLEGSVFPVEERPLARIFRGEALHDQELRVRNRRAGWERVFSFGGSLVRDPGGRPLMGVITVRDVTARRVADEALLAERERLAVTLRSIGDAVIATDAQACVTELNDMAAALTGWTAREAAGRRLEDVFRIADESTRVPARNPVDRVLREGNIVGLADETLLVARDGTERPIAASAAPIRDARGRIQGVVLAFRDKTEERRSAQAILRSEQRLRALIEKSTDIIAVVDADLRVRFWSPSATEILGWTGAEVLGRTVPELGIVHTDDLAVIARERQRLLRDPSGSARVVARFRTRAGGWKLIEALARNRLDDPAVNGFVVNLRDITEQQRLEEQLRQAQRLESVGRLAGGIAHDFNNLLTVILSCCEALRDDLLAARPVNADDVDEIRSAGARATELTRQLLAFARRQVIAPVPLDLNEVVRGSERLLRRILGEDIELVVTMEPGLWSTYCDPGQMEQVILNLAVNARDAMPGGGRLAIETSNVELRGLDRVPEPEMPPGDYVRLRVQDTGVGMAPEIQERVFEPFFTTKEVGKGTGLGLATVYGIVKQSGGFIRVESQPGQGASFEICFPRSVNAVAVAPGVPHVGSREGSETILLVEDNLAVRGVAARALRGAGYSVHEAASGAEALALVERGGLSVHLLVTDVVMPGMDGRSLATVLRSKHPAARVLFVSGYPQDTSEHHGVPGPPVAFLPKPFTSADLLARIRAILDDGAGEAPSG